MKALNSGKERVVAATVGSLRQYLARAGYSAFGWRDTDGNVLAISHLSSQRLAFALVITCVIAITVAMFPVDGFAQTPPNNAATGAPSITGTARVGQALTADTSGIADADGKTKAENGDTGYAYSYKWFRVDSDGTSNKTEITGQTASAYTLASDDVGKKIIVEARFTDDEDNSEGPLASDSYPGTGTVAALSGIVVTIEADQESAVFRDDEVSFTISRTGDTAEVDVSVELTQTNEYLDESSLSWTVVIAEDDSDGTITIPTSRFTAIPEGKPVASGTLTATIISATGYDVGTPAAAEVDIVVAMTFEFDMDSYTVDESDETLSFKVIARTGEGAAAPTGNLFVSVSAVKGQAESPSDYSALSAIVRFSPSDFSTEGSVSKAEKSLTVVIVDDDENDSGETLSLELKRSPSLGIAQWNFVDTSDKSCGTKCAVTVTITDNDAEKVRIESVSIISSPVAASDTYGAGEMIVFTVDFDDTVVVDTTDGTPRLLFKLGNSGSERDEYLKYVSGSGTATLRFEYTVQSTDVDDDGINIDEDALELAGGTISDATDGLEAILGHEAIGLLTSDKVDGSQMPAIATLAALSLSGVTLSPAFDSEVTSYTGTVPNGITTTTVIATPSAGDSAVTTPDDDDSGTDGHQVALEEGANEITVTVSGTGKVPRTYTVRVTREEADITDATLFDLALADDDSNIVTLDPEFESETTSYTASVKNAIDRVTFIAITGDSNAAVEYFDDTDTAINDADDMAGCQQILLAVGENTVKVRVTAGDSLTTRSYTVVVTRGPASALVVSPSELDIDEAGSDTFTVNLTTRPAADVTVSVRSDDVGAATVSPADLTFTPSGWNDTQTVTVSGESDDDADNESLTVELEAMSADSGYDGRAASVSVNVIDASPQVTVEFAEEAYAVDEGGTQEIEVTLSADPKREVVIPLNANGQDGASHQDFSGVYAWLRFGPGETSKTFSFSATQDFDDDDGESVIITFGDLPPGVSRGTTDATTVDIIDDEFGDPEFNLGTLGAFWTHTDDADGNLLVGACAGSGSYTIIWSAREDRRGADEWLAHIISHGGFNSDRHSFRESPGSLPGLYEMNGTVRLQGEGSLTIRVRGRFGDIWGTWSPPVGLFCLNSLDQGQ